jgi:anti-sigma factor RsiW
MSHWTEEQLIHHLYGIGPSDDHVTECAECRARLHEMRQARESVESRFDMSETVDSASLASARRAIYARIDAGQRRSPWQLPGRIWATAALGIALLGGALTFHGTHSTINRADEAKVSDTQLAQQVSQIADNTEPAAAAPLEALFEE